MGPERIRGVGRSRFLTVSAAAGLALAGLALQSSNSAGTGTFRDAAYGPAPKNHIKLTGVVSGTVNCVNEGRAVKCTKISIRKGSKAKHKVGTWIMGPGSCVGFGPGTECGFSGTGKKMTVGRLKGKVDVQVHCAKSDTGTLSQNGKADEILSLKKCLGHAKGDRFKFTLGY
jgi:hypothetical protein